MHDSETHKNHTIKLPIYLDHQSTTMVDERVLSEMLPYFSSKFGNPDSNNHRFGFEANAAVELGRTRVADVIGVNPSSLIFTSSATEANNLVFFGISHICKHFITLQTEHKSVLEPLRFLEKNGSSVSYLPVQQNGILDLEVLSNEIRRIKSTKNVHILVSTMFVHNEIGVIQPIEEIGKICSNEGVFFHSDISQGFGKISVNMSKINIDFASISAHKIYGPKGIGGLYSRNPKILRPIIYGGGQEHGLRSSTLPVPLIVGFGKASSICTEEMISEYNHLKNLFDIFLSYMPESITLNGDREIRWPGNISLNLLRAASIRDIAYSSGSACMSGSNEMSNSLIALGLNPSTISKVMRIGMGRYTKEDEIKYAISLILKSQGL